MPQSKHWSPHWKKRLAELRGRGREKAVRLLMTITAEYLIPQYQLVPDPRHPNRWTALMRWSVPAIELRLLRFSTSGYYGRHWFGVAASHWLPIGVVKWVRVDPRRPASEAMRTVHRSKFVLDSTSLGGGTFLVGFDLVRTTHANSNFCVSWERDTKRHKEREKNRRKAKS